MPGSCSACMEVASVADLMAIMDGLKAEHSQASAQYSKLQQQEKLQNLIRRQMDQMVKLGDTITQEDLIKASGKLVTGGMDAVAVAGLLAQMPPDGEALQAWVAQHDQMLQQRAQQLQPVIAAARHQMGISALHLLQAHAVAGRVQPAVPSGNDMIGPANAAAGAGPTNPLMGAPSSAN